ncbi:HD domain-containing protein [Flavihumibacter fluvii]|uniref:HD domain-containing protein n=1 Tax=Flavihumibacter fluvii TaxID=2838157 RepID=UPI001BDE6445|nr:HDIG domain-containing metalloprotein [Flavihumibacter fluvii]ULQ52032.1 HDIG domain-containing protein [Flavihumibacter fluvii]
MLSSQSVTDEIFSLFEQFGAEEYAGEKVSQLEHMYQAAQLATSEGYDDEVILAAFLHDVGHLLPVENKQDRMVGSDGLQYGMVEHEKLGAEWLRSMGLGERMCKLIASHVNAKRYLTLKDPEYYDQLSTASKQTLEYQGGRMSPAEAQAFESDPLFELYIRMRRWDEAAKLEDQPVGNLGELKSMLRKYLEKRGVSY